MQSKQACYLNYKKIYNTLVAYFNLMLSNLHIAELRQSDCLKDALLYLRQFLTAESSLKMMENVCILPSVLRSQNKRFDLKEKVSFNNCDVTTWKKTIAMHILPSISRHKSDRLTNLVS